jgi:hypothetical protein
MSAEGNTYILGVQYTPVKGPVSSLQFYNDYGPKKTLILTIRYERYWCLK